MLELVRNLKFLKQKLNCLEINNLLMKKKNEINKISLSEILNINRDFKINQNLIGYWNYGLNKNINEGLDQNLSLKTFFFKNY